MNDDKDNLPPYISLGETLFLVGLAGGAITLWLVAAGVWP